MLGNEGFEGGQIVFEVCTARRSIHEAVKHLGNGTDGTGALAQNTPLNVALTGHQSIIDGAEEFGRMRRGQRDANRLQ